MATEVNANNIETLTNFNTEIKEVIETPNEGSEEVNKAAKNHFLSNQKVNSTSYQLVLSQGELTEQDLTHLKSVANLALKHLPENSTDCTVIQVFNIIYKQPIAELENPSSREEAKPAEQNSENTTETQIEKSDNNDETQIEKSDNNDETQIEKSDKEE
ncbi:MAG: hypothetical protein AAF443_03960 [Chlamydiota bacterium]